ncbi:hypothetical protein F9883_01945 [Morganella morganii]|uniref:ABC-three component system protein n=1 Tax=Morganella morganii TaxID=582 RepID=UPI0015F365CC|nr:ABC-three component system protein [Morganella morganii]MBA5806649.1 hypothetical protein [Morganella morganii]
MAFDASPSWSGFNYQGKVALYYALTRINENSVGSNFGDQRLMLEDNEDFEILENGSSVSFHQVKAYNSSSYSKYSNALLEITLELYKNVHVSGKIHTWKNINAKLNFCGLMDSLKDDIKILLDEYEGAVPKIGNTIIEKAASTSSNNSKRAAILKAAFPTCNEQALYEILNNIHSGNNNAISRLAAYVYDDGNSYCELELINEKIKLEISKALTARNLINTQERLDKTFQYFLGMMDAYIIQRHKEKQQSEKVSITFEEIILAIIYDHEDIGINYLAYKFKEQFAYLIDEYISDPEDYMETEIDVPCNLKEIRKLLLSLSPIELWMYYRNFCPHIDLQNINNTANSLLSEPTGIRHVLIKILHELDISKISNITKKCQLIYETTTLPSKKFLPSTILKGVRTSYIERKIISNKNMWELLFEVENIVYDGEEVYEFSPTSITHTEAPRFEDEDPRSKRDDILKSISLVPISIAKNELIQ